MTREDLNRIFTEEIYFEVDRLLLDDFWNWGNGWFEFKWRIDDTLYHVRRNGRVGVVDEDKYYEEYYDKDIDYDDIEIDVSYDLTIRFDYQENTYCAKVETSINGEKIGFREVETPVEYVLPTHALNDVEEMVWWAMNDKSNFIAYCMKKEVNNN